MEFLVIVPLWAQLLCLFCFGIIIGSFLNVVLYRLHTGKSLSGHSHCLSCGRRLTALELIPLLSYLGLRGRCVACQSYIPIRYFLVELLTGLLFMGLVLVSESWVEVLFGAVVVSLLVVTAVYDLRHFIIPDELVFCLTVVAMLMSGYELYFSREPLTFALDLMVAFLGTLFFYGLWQISKGTWIGFGDVKLTLPLGLMVGASSVFSMIVLAFWVGAVVGVALLLLQRLQKRGKLPLRFFRTRLTMKSVLPFAPFLISGFLLVWLWDVSVISLLTYARY